MKRYMVKEIFRTIQGEGCNAGRAAVFVRLVGCNLWSGREEDRDVGEGACSRWCDTDFVGGERMTAGDIHRAAEVCWAAQDAHLRLVVFTGGEPLLQLDDELLAPFHQAGGWAVAVETNGTVPLKCQRAAISHLTVSPKKCGLSLQDSVVRTCTELKVVLPGCAPLRAMPMVPLVSDAEWSDQELELLADVLASPNAALYVQPQAPLVGTRGDKAVQRCLDFIYRHPRWRLSLQLHKVLGLP